MWFRTVKKSMQEDLETRLEEFKEKEELSPKHLLHAIRKYKAKYGTDDCVKGIEQDYEHINNKFDYSP